MQLASQMERVIPEPDVTTKQGRLKSGKVRHEPVQTVEDLAKLEVLDEVCKHGWGRGDMVWCFVNKSREEMFRMS